MGVVGRPSAVTGFAAISIMAEMTFMPGRHSSSKISHTAGALGLAWRLISKATVLFAIWRVSLCLLGCVVAAWTRFDELRVDVFVFEARTIVCPGEAGLGGLQEFFIIALGEVGLVVRAARLVTKQCSQSNGPGELKHVFQLTGEGE